MKMDSEMHSLIERIDRVTREPWPKPDIDRKWSFGPVSRILVWRNQDDTFNVTVAWRNAATVRMSFTSVDAARGYIDLAMRDQDDAIRSARLSGLDSADA